MAFTQHDAQDSAQNAACKFDRDFPLRREDSESDPSTEFGSDGSESECSVEDCNGSDFAVPFAIEDTFLIFDWDDTLLPTTWIEKEGLRLDGPPPAAEQELQLQRMAELAEQTLKAAKALGKVILVTNAERGWVEFSCQKFMPGLYHSLQDVRILSARSTYEHQGVAQPSEWKYLAFQQELERFCEEQRPVSGEADTVVSRRRRNVISVGDSPHEREALIRVTAHMPDSRVKAIKLMARPEVQQLRQEHEIISDCFHDLVYHDGNVDLAIDCP